MYLIVFILAACPSFYIPLYLSHTGKACTPDCPSSRGGSLMPDSYAPMEVFCSYAAEDERWLRRLETHLSLLRRQGLISTWYDHQIVPGTDWTRSIDKHMEQASIILLLISSSFLASDYCYGIEMKRVLERQEVGEARVIPILLRPTI